MPHTDAEYKLALKAFKKKIKHAQLEEDSKLGRSPLSGTKARILSVQPPTGHGREIWRELAEKGHLIHDGGGFYSLAPEHKSNEA